MDIVTVCIAALGTFLVIALGVLPLLRKRLEKDLTDTVITPYAYYHLFAMLQTVSFATGLGALLVVATVGYLDVRGTASVEDVSATLQLARDIRDLAVGVNGALTIGVFLLLSSGLAWLSFRQAKQRATKLFESIRAEERERVIEGYKNDQWETLPPTEMMTKVAGLFDARKELLENRSEEGTTEHNEAIAEELDHLRDIYFTLDIERRMSTELKTPLASDLILPETAHIADRIRNCILNRGVMKSLQGASRVLTFSMLVVLLPSVTSIDLAVGLAAFEQRIVKLEELRVRLDKNEADRLLQQALANPTPPPPVATSISDEQAKEEVAESYDQAFVQHLLAHSITPATRMHLARAEIREQILRDYSVGSPHSLEVSSGPHVPEGQNFLEQAKKRFHGQLDAIRQEHVQAWESIKSSVPRSADFSYQLSRSDVRQALVGELFKTALSANATELEATYEIYASQYLSSLAKGESMEGAERVAFLQPSRRYWTAQVDDKIHAIQQHSTGEGEIFDRALRENPPTLQNHPVPLTQVQQVERILQEMPARMQSSEVLYGYQDLIPGRLGDETRTAASEVAEHLGQAGGIGTGSGGGGSSSPTRKPSKVAFERSYNYKALRGFSRVGGVLIGRPPENEAATADIVEMSWEWSGKDSLTLSLISGGGKIHKFGPYNRSVMHQALTYAADQRPLAVTMITARPVPDLKIITHPALIDTPLGCRTVMLDRITDEATSRREYRVRAEQLTHTSNTLYQLTWGIAAKRLSNTGSGLHDKDREALERLSYRTIVEAKRTLAESYSALRASIERAEETPITAKRTFYSRAIADSGLNCAKQSNSIDELTMCIDQALPAIDIEDLVAHLPEFQVWSGVRELPYSIDDDLNFLREPSNNKLWPFDFVLQTAFTRQGLIDSEEIRDESPWEFPALHKQLVEDVEALIQKDPLRQALIRDVRTFTILQRLFRTGLNGQLGSRFPVTRLRDLSRELKGKSVQSADYKTPRWNTRPLEAMYLQAIFQLTKSGEVKSPRAIQLARSTSNALQRCIKQLQKPVGQPSNESCDLAAVVSTARSLEDDASAQPMDRALGEEVRNIAGIIQLRQELGVSRIENVSASSCPPL